MKIKTFEKLIKKLKIINKINNNILIFEELYDSNDENSFIIQYDVDYNIESIVRKEPYVQLASKEYISEIGTMFYENNGNLFYCTINGIKKILEKPTYDEVYNFCYNYYICPLNLNKDKYKSLNKIFKRRIENE